MDRTRVARPRRWRLLLAAAGLAWLAWLPAQAAAPLGEVASPDGRIQVQMAQDAEGRPTWRLLREGREVVAPSPLGLVGEGADLSRALAFSGAGELQAVADDYELLSGKRRLNQYRANRRVFRWQDAQGQELAVAWQVSNDGAAFRYELDRPVSGMRRWHHDAATFRLPSGSHAWLQPMAVPKTGFGRTNPSYEEFYLQDVPVGTPTPMGHGWVFPALFRAGEDWVLLSEGVLRRGDAGSRLLDGARPGEYVLGFPDEREAFPGGDSTPWIGAFPWRSPWRIVTVGTLATVVDSTLGTDLADPPAVDVAAVPGKASWSWPLLGDESTVFEVQKQFVDYAADMGWRYTLVDALWDQQIGDARMRELVEYARGRNVQILAWYNSAGAWNDAPQTPRGLLLDRESRRREFQRMRDLGVVGLKIDFFGGDGASMIAYYLDLMEDAAPYGLQLNFHGATLPRGWQRTWPHLRTVEAVRGLEFATFNQADADQQPVHAATLPFVRNVFDPMDYTPLAMIRLNDRVQRRTSPAFELAESVLFVSGIQHYAETAAGMAQVPEYVRQFLRALPELWDDSRFIDGYPGRFAVFARQGGGQWFVGGINAGPEARTVTLQAETFGAGVRRGTLITDGDQAPGFARRPVEFAPGRPLQVELAPQGGFVLQLD